MRCKKSIYDRTKGRYRVCKNSCGKNRYCYKHTPIVVSRAVSESDQVSMYADFDTVYSGQIFPGSKYTYFNDACKEDKELVTIDLTQSMETDKTIYINDEIMCEPVNKDINVIVEDDISIVPVDSDDANDWQPGKCCFCNDDCNPCSQACGRCSRTLSWRGMAALEGTLGKRII